MAGDNDELYNDELYGGKCIAAPYIACGCPATPVCRCRLGPAFSTPTRTSKNPLELGSHADLDDLDEELVDPDDDPSQQAPAAPTPVAAAPATSAPAQQQPYQGGPPASGSAPMAGQPYNFQSDAGPSGQVGGPGGADQGDLDRIRPSDMPDEGLVLFPLPYRYLCRVGRVVAKLRARARLQCEKRRSIAITHSAIAIPPPLTHSPSSRPLDRRRRQTHTDTILFVPQNIQHPNVPYTLNLTIPTYMLARLCLTTPHNVQQDVHRRSQLGDDGR